MVKWSCAPVVGRLLLACVVATNFCSADPTDDSNSVTRTRLERIQPDAPVAFRLADPKLIPEGIAYDSKGDRFFIGSVAQKKIVSANRKGNVKDFSKPEDNLDCVLGLVFR